jgi:hypothetical protein
MAPTEREGENYQSVPWHVEIKGRFGFTGIQFGTPVASNLCHRKVRHAEQLL